METQRCNGINQKGLRCGSKKKTEAPFFCSRHVDQRVSYDSDSSMASAEETRVSSVPVKCPPLVVETVAALADLMKSDLSLKPADKKDQILILIQDVETSLKKLRIAIAEL